MLKLIISLSLILKLPIFFFLDFEHSGKCIDLVYYGMLSTFLLEILLQPSTSRVVFGGKCFLVGIGVVIF